MPLPQALNKARELDLDLVEVADKAHPPVCRIMDYKKYVYESKQRAKESRKKTTQVVVKEMKYRPKIGGGDFDTKTRKVEKFLSQGHKVKITIMFRGRELSHPQLGRKILDQIAEQMDYLAKIEAYPRLDGRNMTMVLGPDPRKKQQKKAKEANRAEAAAQDKPVAAKVKEVKAPVAEAPVAEVPEAEAPDTQAPETQAPDTPIPETPTTEAE